MLPLLIGGIVLIGIALIGLCWRIIKKSYIILLLILSAVVLTYSITELYVFNYDIKHTNFDVYCGNFDYVHVSGNRKDILEFPDSFDLHIRSVADLGISDGPHSGYILYGKNSRWVIAYSDSPFK